MFLGIPSLSMYAGIPASAPSGTFRIVYEDTAVAGGLSTITVDDILSPGKEYVICLNVLRTSGAALRWQPRTGGLDSAITMYSQAMRMDTGGSAHLSDAYLTLAQPPISSSQYDTVQVRVKVSADGALVYAHALSVLGSSLYARDVFAIAGIGSVPIDGFSFVYTSGTTTADINNRLLVLEYL